MIRYVVDTNVAIVANDRRDLSRGARPPSIDCREAAVKFLMGLIDSHIVLLDSGGEILSEYRTYLRSSGEPGVGDRFYYMLLRMMGSPEKVVVIELPRTDKADYQDFPADPELAGFDPSDRKFAALARRGNAPVVNATDTDWLHHRAALEKHGITVEFICGCRDEAWFAT